METKRLRCVAKVGRHRPRLAPMSNNTNTTTKSYCIIRSSKLKEAKSQQVQHADRKQAQVFHSAISTSHLSGVTLELDGQQYRHQQNPATQVSSQNLNANHFSRQASQEATRLSDNQHAGQSRGLLQAEQSSTKRTTVTSTTTTTVSTATCLSLPCLSLSTCRPAKSDNNNDDTNLAIEPNYWLDDAKLGRQKCCLPAAGAPKTRNKFTCRIPLLLLFIWLNLVDWRPEPKDNRVDYILDSDSIFDSFAQKFIINPTQLHGIVFGNALGGTGLKLVSAQQYRPEWPHKSLEQEIFLLNLEDGYFGCQVNSSQDFLQLFELSRLCDGQAQCYLGTDELETPLKCKNRSHCGTHTNSRGQQENIQCINGVCLDGLCYCNDGFGGKSCDIPDENECKFRPCDVFAHCTNTMGSYYCSCFPGYDGDGIHCQDINECEIPSLKALCSDNSECVNLPGHFVCKCKPGYQQSDQSQSSLTGAPIGNTTVQCTDIDECLDERTCGKGAICENLPGSFRCACPPGFTGDPAVECVDMDECRNHPCGIGAQCTNIPGGYRCSCAPGFERNPAAPANLFGTIQSVANSQQLIEFTNSSLIACLDINECVVSTTPGIKPVCGSGAQCINTAGAYFCQCPPGYNGNPKVACLDIDECASHACGPNTLCKNTPGNFKCECKPGYTGNAYSPDGCQDEDECLRRDACGLNAQCFNTLGSYQCSCQSGYSGDAYTKCTDIDECASGSPCGPGAQCHNLEGGYKCTCPDKYLARGTPEMGCERAAVDIGCSGDFDCTQNALCVNSTCQCKLGYQISGIECVDVDECAVSLQPAQNVPTAPVKAFTRLNLASHNQLNSSSTLCGSEATCRNTDGSYLCDCKPGYEKSDPTLAISKCRDINECERSNPCGQNSKCFNTEGSFECACNDGFIPIDQDPANGCKSPCDGVNCGHHATCKPHDKEAACVCKPGFTFDPNNIKLGCVDINECDPNYGPSGLCGQRAICTNEPGTYRCHCPSGFAGDAYRYCEDINECDRKFGVFGQCGELAICTNKPGSFSCACAPGYTGDPKTKCTDIDECSSKFGPNGKCGINAICTNTPGRYSCRCPPGYSGDPNEKCVPEQASCTTSADCQTNQVCQSGRCHCPFAQQPGAELECRHPCDKTECGAHATCQLDSDNQALCVCDAGYMAPSDGRSGCTDVNECIQGLTLSGMTPISTLSSGGAIALGPNPTTLAPPTSALNTTGGHPCGRNALCRNQPGSFDCVCPPGYTGNAYESCILEVKDQQQQAIAPPSTTSTNSNQQSTATTSANTAAVFGNYQQEPRATACSEPCTKGHVCSDGQCIKPDSCRDNQDCRTTMACEHVNLVLGFQCVNVCELNLCGPEAKCSPLNHKPICSCNSTAGYAGDPYDLVNGCRPQSEFNDIKQTTTNQNFGQAQFGSLTTKHDLHQTSLANQQQHSDISTVSFDSGTSVVDQQPISVSHNTSTTSMDQLQRHQVLEQQTKRPNEPYLAYEVPLPTTPILPQFDSYGQTSTTALFGQQQNITTQQQVLVEQKDITTTTATQNQVTQTTSSTQSPIGSAFSRQQQQQQLQQQQQQQQTTTTSQNIFSNKRIQQQHQQPLIDLISNNQQFNTNNRQDNVNDLSQQRAQQTFEQRQDSQTTKSSQQQHLDDSNHGFNQFINRSSALTTTTSYVLAHRKVACTSDQHCPGNLFCLGPDLNDNTKSIQKTCGCPPGYRREADYCFMHRVNCTSSAVCKAREECISSNVIRQYYANTNPPYLQQTTISQQFALSNIDESTAGICICPRGYKLTASGIACIDRNECDEGTPCAVGAICQNKIGSYECVCPPGTVGEPYTKTCEPIVKDECQTNSDCANDRECDLATRKCISPCHVCGPRAICTAANHAAICLCPPRYTGNAIDQVYGCQEPPLPPPPPTTTTTTTVATTTISTSTTTSRPTTVAGVPVTTLLPPTTVAPIETTTSVVEFRTIPPSELYVMCLADGIQVEVQLGGFDGIIYVKGHSQDPKCRKLVMSNSANDPVEFKVQFGHCDLIHRDGEAGFVLVIQKHPKLVTYRARAYHVKCVYNTGERTVTLGFNVSMITTSGTIANTGPPPTCLMSITSLDGREVTSAEIGQDLLLRVDVQPDSIYGGFARSCEAKTMDDEGEYQYEVTDANGCATDPSIFSDWKYDQHRKSLVARFNAFKFPSSNNLRFQCNIRVCFGSCPAVNCNGIDAYGRRRRRREAPTIEGTNFTSNEDGADAEADIPTDELIVTDTFKEGALREEIMVQSNAILTFDKKETSLPQQRPPIEDIEFVCLPRLGIVMSIALTTLLALLALAIATSCWCFAKKKRQNRLKNGPLPHPMDFPNPLMRSTSASTLREPIYGP